MRVAFVFAVPAQIGGHLRSAGAMAENLISLGHEVRVLAPGGDPEMLDLYRALGVEVRLIPGLDAPIGLQRPSVAGEILREAGPDTRVLHAQDPRAGPISMWAAARGRRGFVQTLAGGPVPDYPTPPRADLVVFSPEQHAGFAERARAAGTRLHLIAARIDGRVFRPLDRDPAFAKRFEWPSEGAVAVAAVRFAESKRGSIETILEAAVALRSAATPVTLLVAGDGPLLPDFRARADELRHSVSGAPVLRAIGGLTGTDDLVQLYNHADVVVGTGRGIMEAMACERPVIVLGDAGHAEIVAAESVEAAAFTNFSGRHFEGRDRRGPPLAELIEAICADPELSARLSRFSSDYAQRELDARRGAERLAEIYARAAAQPVRMRAAVLWEARYLALRLLRRVRA